MIPHVLIGNPKNRRVLLFQEALARRRHPAPRVFSHAELIESPERLLELDDAPYLVRIDSTGEDAEVERALLRSGYEDALALGVSTVAERELDSLPLERGLVVAPTQRHLGMRRYLHALHAVFALRPQLYLLSPVEAIDELFDKRRASASYRHAGIPTPRPLLGVETVADLRDAMDEASMERVYVKHAAGSSASCLALFSRRAGRELLMSTLRRRPDGYYNSLRVVRLDDREAIETTLGFLLREGAQIEESVPKARLGGAQMDCRVLLIAGEPSFLVVRQSHHPITNLHLGGHRGSHEELLRRVPPEVYERAMQSCRQVAAHHRCFQLGIDLLFTPRFRDHCIVEANAFGDLLPGLERDGLSVYEWQIDRAQRWAEQRYSGPKTPPRFEHCTLADAMLIEAPPSE